MKILVINGSPHPHGTTSLLRDAFEEGAKSKGHSITTFHAGQETLHSCLGCDHCRTADEGCVYKDGMETLNPLLLEADCVVFVTPLYYFGMSSQLKMVIDRFYANNAKLREQNKKAVLLAACGDADEWTLDALDHHYHALCTYLRWENAGEINAIGMYTPDDLKGSDYIEKARALGSSLD